MTQSTARSRAPFQESRSSEGTFVGGGAERAVGTGIGSGGLGGARPCHTGVTCHCSRARGPATGLRVHGPRRGRRPEGAAVTTVAAAPLESSASTNSAGTERPPRTNCHAGAHARTNVRGRPPVMGDRPLRTVELRGFEPLTPSMRTRCATGLRYSPEAAPRLAPQPHPFTARRRSSTLSRSTSASSSKAPAGVAAGVAEGDRNLRELERCRLGARRHRLEGVGRRRHRDGHPGVVVHPGLRGRRRRRGCAGAGAGTGSGRGAVEPAASARRGPGLAAGGRGAGGVDGPPARRGARRRRRSATRRPAAPRRPGEPAAQQQAGPDRPGTPPVRAAAVRRVTVAAAPAGPGPPPRRCRRGADGARPRPAGSRLGPGGGATTTRHRGHDRRRRSAGRPGTARRRKHRATLRVPGTHPRDAPSASRRRIHSGSR